MAELSFVYSYGGYNYDPLTNGLTTVKAPPRIKERTAATPGRDGAYGGGGLMDARTITATGSIVAADTGTLRSLQDTFYAAHAPGYAKQLSMNTDRYFWASVTGLDCAETEGLDFWSYTITYTAYDPFQYSTSASSSTLTSGSNTVTCGGTAYSVPAITIPVTAAPQGGSITIANTTTGQSTVLYPSSTSTYVLDSRLETALIGTTDATGDMDGQYLTLAPGSNTISLTLAGGATVGTVSMVWNARWY